jgi:uncharacterized protein YacL
MIDVAIAIFLGIIYGYVKPGREDRIGLLKKGLVIGLIIGVIIGLLSAFLVSHALFSGLAFIGAGFITVFVVFLFTIFFLIGTFIGDFLEHALKT